MVIMMKIMMEKIYRVKIEQSMAVVSWWAGLPTKVTVNIGQIWNGRGAFEDDNYLDCEIFGDMMMLLSF